ncbi:hypothetical protein [Effusibacillus lacus]|uniref:Uncharacterized protein n=1 Tax=Effusibacillus lacus TaxID=1348429 RepID=A0A292YJI8_9BACL|nr:hypothetical protein [Effusibacillus lacus]TCS75118.1 hypothetical protein EDD64_10943 [Effusibacillus lacus]GAX89071.1 hypothetical protein EFBL_0685 [Effusibacillus lacus]
MNDYVSAFYKEQIKPPEPPKLPSYCSACGKKQMEGYLFCHVCGTTHEESPPLAYEPRITNPNSLSNLLIVVAFSLIGIGAYSYDKHSDNYLTQLYSALNTPVQPSSVQPSPDTPRQEQHLPDIQFYAKTQYDMERTKDFLLIGSGALAGLIAAAARRD